MMNAEEMNRIIWNLINCLHGIIFSPDKLSSSVVRLLFLKYAVDNSIGATDLDSMEYCAKAQKVFAKRDTESGLETIIPVLQNIDLAYNLSSIISNNDTVEQYAAELFGMDRLRQKKNTTDLSFKRVMEMLASIDLEEESKESHDLGRLLVDALVAMTASAMEGNKMAASSSTSIGLAKLAKAILNVKRNDTYCDFACGKGLSTIEITGETLPQVTNIDIVQESASISAMLLIMYGYEHFSVKCEDSLREKQQGISGNKIFVDPPIGIRLQKAGEEKSTDSILLACDRIIHDYLSSDGIAVVTTPSGPLFRQGTAIGIKNEMVSLGLLYAVIALPPMWSGTTIGTNLLVLRKTPSRNTLFVDASDLGGVSVEKKRARGSSILTEKRIQEIAEVIHNPHDIPGFAKVVPSTEISAKEYNLIPANYVIKQIEEDTTTLAEIDEQLTDLYRQLNL